METPDDNVQAPSELELLKRRADQLGVAYSNNIGIATLKARINEKLGVESDEAVDQAEDTESEGDEDVASENPEASASAAPVNGFEAAAAVAAAKTTTTEQELTAPETRNQEQVAPVVMNEDLVKAALEAMGLTPEIIAQAVALKSGAVDETPVPVLNRNGKVKAKSLRSLLHDKHMRLVRVRVTCMNPAKKDLQGEVFSVANKHLGTVKKFVPFGEKTEEGWHIPEIIYKMMQRRKYVSISTYKDKATGYEKQKKTLVKEFAIEVLPPLTEKELNALAVAQLAAGSIEAND